MATMGAVAYQQGFWDTSMCKSRLWVIIPGKGEEGGYALGGRRLAVWSAANLDKTNPRVKVIIVPHTG